MDLTKAERVALKFLARGGARYGTRLREMRLLKDKGLAYAHDKGTEGPGRWTWRPTQAGWHLINDMGLNR